MAILADYPGISTYETTWAHVALVVLAVLLMTYPASIVAGLLGLIPTGGNAFRRANRIAVVQAGAGVVSFLVCCAICFFLLIAIAVIGGLLVSVGMMEPVDNLVTLPLLVLFGFVHVVGQIAAFIWAERHTRSEVTDA